MDLGYEWVFKELRKGATALNLFTFGRFIMHICCFDDVKYQQTRIVKVVQTSLTYEMYEPLLLQIVACDRVLRYECFFAHGKIWGLWAIGLATSCRWIPKKLLIKVSKSCQKVAENLPKFFCFSYLSWALKIKNSSNDNIRGSFHFIWSTNSLSEWHEQNMVIYTHNEQNSFHVTCCLTLFQYEIHSRMTEFDDVLSSNNDKLVSLVLVVAEHHWSFNSLL